MHNPLVLRNGICLGSGVEKSMIAAASEVEALPSGSPRCAAAPACRLTPSLRLLPHSALGVLRFVWAYFLRPRRNLRWYGQWAVVTGATDGIGKEYAAQLARQGGCWLPWMLRGDGLRHAACCLGCSH